MHVQRTNSKLMILKEFLDNCLIKFVCLKWIVARIYKSKLKYGCKVKKLFVKSEINKNIDLISKLKTILVMDIERLKNTLDIVDFKSLEIYIQSVIKKQSLKVKIKNQKNMNRLVSSKCGS